MHRGKDQDAHIVVIQKPIIITSHSTATMHWSTHGSSNLHTETLKHSTTNSDPLHLTIDFIIAPDHMYTGTYLPLYLGLSPG